MRILYRFIIQPVLDMNRVETCKSSMSKYKIYVLRDEHIEVMTSSTIVPETLFRYNQVITHNSCESSVVKYTVQYISVSDQCFIAELIKQIN